jgi:DNA repair photolyase
MKRGQVFILIAFIISIMLSQLGNLYTYSNLPIQTEQTKISNTIDILKNIQNEIGFLYTITPFDSNVISDFELYAGNFSAERSYVANFSG